MGNHKKHYILWDGIVKKLEQFKKAGILYVNEDDIDLMKTYVCKNHPNLDESIHCYACAEAGRIKYKKNSTDSKCYYCPIDWRCDFGVTINYCGRPKSSYRRLIHWRNIDDAILLAIKIRDAEWKYETQCFKNSISLSEFQKHVHKNAVNKGFWESNSVIEKLAFIHEEVSETLQAYRNSKDDEIPEELADIVLRTLDLAEHLEINLSKELIRKHSKNLKRPYLHGKKC